MAEINDEFQLKARADAEKHKRTDFDDLQNELAGRETGRMKRFLSRDARDARDPKKKAEHREEHMSRLQRLLVNNASYAALYEETFDKLREAEEAVERALSLAIAAQGKAKQLLQETLDNAQRLPDGTRVFRDANGVVLSEEGDKIAPELAEGIQWRGDEPSYEQFIQQRETLENITQSIDGFQTGQVNVLGKIREEMTDEDNPPSKERLEEIGKELDSYQRDISRTMSNLPLEDRMSAEAPITSAASAATKLTIPEL